MAIDEIEGVEVFVVDGSDPSNSFKIAAVWVRVAKWMWGCAEWDLVKTW
ncbi:hypothetical protein SynSYN20_03184 [Synechococcus sp. SYN20]|nr:hypothetical protein [Synechococcus sp. SYN20]QNJ27476.1 hypothetical protein SynSYN20_03184 [Synechococcus sp. SYN20]